MKKNSAARKSRIRNPQKIKACIHPALLSCINLVWPNAIFRVILILSRIRSFLPAALALNKIFNLGQAAAENRIRVKKDRVPSTRGWVSDDVQSNA